MSERIAPKTKIKNLPSSAKEQEVPQLWMARLYLLRKRIEYSNIPARENYHWGKEYVDMETNRTLEIAQKADKLVNQPDFEKKGRLGEAYQKLLEEFAQIEAGKLVLDIPKTIAAPYIELSRKYDEKIDELKKEAKKISSKHRSLKERAQYAIFALRSSLKDSMKDQMALYQKRTPIIGVSKGMEQLMKDSMALDKEKGKYRIYYGDGETSIETKSRLAALSYRNFDKITPVPPTRPFLTTGVTQFVKLDREGKSLMREKGINA